MGNNVKKENERNTAQNFMDHSANVFLFFSNSNQCDVVIC